MGQLSFIDYNVQVIDQDLSSLNHGTCNHLILFPNKNWKRNKNTHKCHGRILFVHFSGI